MKYTLLLLFAAACFVPLGVSPTFAQQANDCVDVRNTSNTAFFKSQMYNGCNKTIVVHYCMANACRSSSGYYTSSETLSPGESAPVDTEGNGVYWAACVYEAPDWDTPISDSSGRFRCG